MTDCATRKAVLVLTNTEDGTADPVIHRLQERDVPVVRMDPGDFPATMTIEASLDGEAWKGSVHDAFRGVDLASVRSVYYRRPSQFTLTDGMSGPEQRWAYREARMGFGVCCSHWTACGSTDPSGWAQQNTSQSSSPQHFGLGSPSPER